MRSLRRPAACVLGVTLTASLASVPIILAQLASRPASVPPIRAPHTELPVPFTVGETLTYNVSWSPFLTAGTVVITVKEKKPSYNSTAYYIVAEGRPTPFLSRFRSVYYKMDTLVDSYTLLPQRGSMYSEEGNRHRFRVTQFDRIAGKALIEYQATTTTRSELAVSADVQDPLSALYLLRVIPLKAGDRILVPVSDSGRNYRLQLDVAGRERLKTPLGELAAWKLRPILYDETNRPVRSDVSVWLSDDPRRLPVKIEGDLPVGKFVLSLSDVR